MGWGKRINVSIKNDRVVLLEKRADAVEQLLHNQIKDTDRKIGENTKALKDLLGTLGNIQSELEFIYEEFISRTVRGRIKRLTTWLGRKPGKK
jgi:hypothetical protein